MKAMALHQHGGPEVLQLVDLPVPAPAKGEVLIRVAAIGANPADWKWRQGMFAAMLPISFPYVPGYDVAGVVERGDKLAPGTRVMAMLDNLKAGAYAEFVTVAADVVAVIPEGLDFTSAAALPCPALTGVQVIDEDIQPAKGETVVITGATGSVGRFALLAAKRRGATVVAAVREGHRQTALELGADQALALDQAGSAVECDHLIDTVGGALVVPWARKVRTGGKIRTVATDPIPADNLPSTPEFSRVHPDSAQLAQIAQDVAAGHIITPPIQTMPLADAAHAHDIMQNGPGGGKIVLIVD